MIVLDTIGGLANRMRFIASMCNITAQSKTPLNVIWHKNTELYADWDDLFQPTDAFQLIHDEAQWHSCKSTVQPSAWKHAAVCLWNKLAGGIDVCLKPMDVTETLKKEGAEQLIRANLSKRILIKSWEEICPTTDYSMFVPIESLWSKICAFRDEHFCDRMIGVHIRRTDHVHAIANSPDSAFFEVMDSYASDSQVRFYLTTDDFSTEQSFIQRYGNRIVSRPKILGRDSVEAMQDGLIDMWLLSMTTEIYGSAGSSFSSVAGRIGDVPVYSPTISK